MYNILQKIEVLTQRKNLFHIKKEHAQKGPIINVLLYLKTLKF
jgi:hypothetical protein